MGCPAVLGANFAFLHSENQDERQIDIMAEYISILMQRKAKINGDK